MQPRNLRGIVYLLLVQQFYLRERERCVSKDSLVRKMSSRLYYLACYNFFFFLVLDTEGTHKREVGLSLS